MILAVGIVLLGIVAILYIVLDLDKKRPEELGK